MASVATVTQQGFLANQSVQLSDGRVFNLGRPGTRRYARRLRKYIRTRLRTEPEFWAAFAADYTTRGRRRDGA